VQRGREEVAALCSVLPEGSEDKAECEEALVYYERMASGDGEACSLAAEAAATGGEGAPTTTSTSPWTSSASSRFADPSCADEKERFESFVRELLYAGSVTAFVKALGRRKREEERRREKGEGGGTSSPPSTSSSPSSSSPSPTEIDAETERRRRGLIALFRRYDRDGNGRLDAAEFREAAAAAGDPLTGSEVAKIFTALDIHGAGVSLDDFLAAVEVGGGRRRRRSFFFFGVFPFFLSFAHPFSLSRIKKKTLPLSMFPPTPSLSPGRGLYEACEPAGGLAAVARRGGKRRGAAPWGRPAALKRKTGERKEKRERERGKKFRFFFPVEKS